MSSHAPIQIIGGSGFIGTRLCELLAREGKSFRIIDKVRGTDFPAETKVADVRELEVLEGAVVRGDILINLAAEHRDDVRPLSAYYDVNVGGARNICLVAERRGIDTIVFTSSVAVYGFAPIGTNESGEINPFNDYGRSKVQAEEIFRAWQQQDPERRRLVIIRPTVVFGERNRGNVYNLLRQIASGRFVMVGSGSNRKSIAYVENVAAFIIHCLNGLPGEFLYNYADKPDFSMTELVAVVRQMFGRPRNPLRVPYHVGLVIGALCDAAAAITGRRYPISAIRVRKFCSDSVYSSETRPGEFNAKVSLADAIQRTVQFEFLERRSEARLFFTE